MVCITYDKYLLNLACDIKYAINDKIKIFELKLTKNKEVSFLLNRLKRKVRRIY